MCVCMEDGEEGGQSRHHSCSLGADYSFSKAQYSIFLLRHSTTHTDSCGRARDLDAGMHMAAQPLAHTLAGQQRCGHILLSHQVSHFDLDQRLIQPSSLFPHPFSAAALGTLEFDLLYDQASCMLHCRVLRAKVCLPPS